MSVQKLLSNTAAYNVWANERFIQWLQTKPETALLQEVPSSYSSILKTLNHIWGVEQFWLSVVAGTPLTNAPRYLATALDVAEVLQGCLAQSHALAAYVATLSEEDFATIVHFEQPWAKGDLPRGEFLQHVFMHSIYHRGQVTTIGRHAGLTDAPMTDYNYYNLAMLAG